MRAYVGCIDCYGLRRFLLEDAVPRNVLRQLITEWSSRSTTVVWAIVADESAEAIRQELIRQSCWNAANLLMNQNAELLPVYSVLPDLDDPRF
jgi:hypothetical protein